MLRLDPRSLVSATFALVLTVGTMAPSAAAGAALISGATGLGCGSTVDCAAPIPGTAAATWAPGDGTGLSTDPAGSVVAAGALPPSGSTLPGSTLPGSTLPGSGTTPAASGPLPAQNQPAAATNPTDDTDSGVDGDTDGDTDSGIGAENGTGTDTNPGTGSEADPLPSADDDAGATTSPSPTSTSTPPASAPTDGPGTAARTQKWGTAQQVDHFTGTTLAWAALSGADGTGRQYTPTAVGVTSGVLALGATGQGATGGVVADTGVPYGRWETRLRAPAADGYTVRLTLSDGDPTGAGTLDFLTLADPTRQRADAQFGGTTGTGGAKVDATGWHNWAVEWTPTGITTYVDGRAWWSVDEAQLGARRTKSLQLGLRVERSGSAATAPAAPLLEVDWVARYVAPSAVDATATTTDAARSATSSAGDDPAAPAAAQDTPAPATTTAPAEPG